MNTFSYLSQSETITSRLVAFLVIGVLSALPAVASASSDSDANLFSGSEVAQLSTEQMSETRGQTNAVCYLGICISLADIGYEAYIQSPVGHISAPSTPATPALPGGPCDPIACWGGPSPDPDPGNNSWGGNSGSFGGFSNSGSFGGGSFGGFSGGSFGSGGGGGNADEDLELDNVNEE